ncbi:hypothetical protein C8D78_3601 [Arthrobacter oryzae]|uniref:Uncharacterized protein n=1 Tax=Arthrobacter oryzae TaxID=409290 RepID=A0A495EA30_9MICC|nr:hypothetical protein C8D78_3601 [Arthrobacter oryzae]
MIAALQTQRPPGQRLQTQRPPAQRPPDWHIRRALELIA